MDYAHWLLAVDALLYKVFALGVDDLIQDVITLRSLYMEGLTPVQAAADERLDFVVYPYRGCTVLDQPASWYQQEGGEA